MKEKRIWKDSLIIGFAMFAIFFGAGDLIFPPKIGLESGAEFIPAIIGVTVSTVLFPMMAVIAVGNVGCTLEDIMRHVHSKLHVLYMVLVILIVCFGTIPRCGGVAYEIGLMGMFPTLPPISKWVFLIVFFGASCILASNRTGLVDVIGKFITPVLVVTLLVIVAISIAHPIAAPSGGTAEHPFSNAFITGINTGDIASGIICAGIVLNAVAEKGYQKGREQKKVLLYVTVVAFVLLTAIFGGLCYLGATGVGLFAPDIDNTALLVGLVRKMAGYTGIVILSVSIISATFTTAAGMIATAADWGTMLSKGRMPYQLNVIVLTVIIFLVSSTGVSNVIALSGPLFIFIFPMSVMMTFLGCFKKIVPNDGVWKGSVGVAIVLGFYQGIQVAVANGLLPIDISALDRLLAWIPLSDMGFIWVLPSIAGGIVGGIIWKALGKESVVDEIDLIMSEE